MNSRDTCCMGFDLASSSAAAAFTLVEEKYLVQVQHATTRLVLSMLLLQSITVCGSVEPS